MNKVLGVILLVAAYGAYELICGLIADDDRVIRGAKILTGAVLSLVVFMALVLIFGGNVS